MFQLPGWDVGISFGSGVSIGSGLIEVFVAGSCSGDGSSLGEGTSQIYIVKSAILIFKCFFWLFCMKSYCKP